jgi:hypothetical protein
MISWVVSNIKKPMNTIQLKDSAALIIIFRKSLPKEWIGLHSVADGRNYGTGREKIGHFIPPRLAQSNGSLKLP